MTELKRLLRADIETENLLGLDKKKETIFLPFPTDDQADSRTYKDNEPLNVRNHFLSTGKMLSLSATPTKADVQLTRVKLTVEGYKTETVSHQSVKSETVPIEDRSLLRGKKVKVVARLTTEEEVLNLAESRSIILRHNE